MIHGKPLLLITWAWMSLFSIEAAVSPNSEVLFHKRHVYILNGQQTVIDSVNLQINNKYGEEEVSVAYDKIFKLKRFKAWVQDSRGNVLGHVPKAAFEDRNRYQETSLYDDQRERVCSTNFPSYPYRFCYTSTVVSKSIFQLAQWEFYSFQSKPLHLAELWIHRPVDYPVRTLLKGVVETRTDTLNQQVVTRYRIKPVTVTEDDMKNPARISVPHFVWVMPEHFNYGVKGSATSWSAFGDWVDQLNKGLTALSDNEQLQARTLVLGLTDTLDIVRVLYHYMQDHTRYVSVNLGIGGLRSYPASYVSINKFGDCKALSMYMKALLECVGISSHLALINRDEYPEPFYAEFPANQFNHMVLVVPLGKDTVWLENTSSNNALGYVDVTTQDRPVLLVDGINSRLVRSPALSMGAVTGSRRVAVTCSLDGDATFTVNHLARGWEYEFMNSLCKEVDAKSLFVYLDRFVPFKHYEMVRFGFRSVDRDSMFNRLELVFRMPKFLQSVQNRFYLPQIPIYKGRLSFTKPDKNTLRYFIPVVMFDTVVYQLPPNAKLEQLPDPVVIECPYGSFRSEFSQTETHLVGTKTFRVLDGTYAPEAYGILYDFVQKVYESEKKSIVLTM